MTVTSVCVDKLRTVRPNALFPYDKACHMYSDTNNRKELVNFGRLLDLKESWLHRGRIVHFDLTASKRIAALALGAKSVKVARLKEEVLGD